MAVAGQTVGHSAKFPAVNARLAAALALVGALTAVAGCGEDSPSEDPKGVESNGVEAKPAAEILDDAAAALRRVKSFHVEATQGTGARRNQVTADVKVPSTLRLVIRQSGTTASIIAVKGTVYIKADEAYWKGQRVGSGGAAQLADKWLKSPTSDADLRDISKGLDPDTLGSCLASAHGTLQKGGTETVDGKEAVVIIDKGDRPGSTPARLFVATTGKPLPLRTIATGKQRPGGTKGSECNDSSRSGPGDETNFSRYNESPDISAPKGAVSLRSPSSGGSGVSPAK